MQRPNRLAPIFGAVVRLALVTAVVSGAGPRAMSAQDPDMSDVDDVLDGQRSLIPADDLVLWWPTRPGGCVNNCDPRNYRISPLLLDDGGATASGASYSLDEHPVCATTVNGPIFPGPMQARVARLFNSAGGAQIATAVANDNATGRSCAGTDNVSIVISDAAGNVIGSTVITTSAESLQLGTADFDHDGLDELLVLNSDEMFVARAVDPSGVNPALERGPSLTMRVGRQPQYDPAFGDLNADGIVDVAWIGGARTTAAPRSVYVVSICPGDVSETICAGAEPFEIIESGVDRGLDSLYGNSFFDGLDPDNPAVSVHVGNFDTARVGDELVILDYQRLDLDTTAAVLRAFDASDSLGLSQRSQVQIFTDSAQANPMFPNNQLDGVVTTSGPLILLDGGVILSEEQAAHQMIVAYTIQNNVQESDTHLVVVSYGSGLTPTVHRASTIATNQLQIVVGVAVGRFSGPDDFGSSAATTNQQIAVLRGAPSSTVLFYDVASTADLTPVLTTSLSSGVSFNESKNLQGNLLRAGDLQGRSLQLGAPEVVRVESTSQPIVVIGAPPMHVDWIQGAGKSAPEVLNMSTAPTIFNSTYTVDSTTTANSSTASTTSYTYGKKTSVSAGAAYEGDTVNISAGAQSTIARVHQNTVSDTYDTYETRRFDASASTGLGDVIWFEYKRQNIYNYPILGAASDDGSPQYVSISVPDGLGDINSLSGSGVEWYQPVHEPGNVFSYPWSFTQLVDRYPNITGPLTESISFATGDSSLATKVTWAAGSGDAQSTGSTNTQTRTTSESASGSIAGVGGGASVDYTASSAYSTLYTSTSTLGASTGVEITKPEDFRDPSNYQYLVEPYVFGEMPPSPPPDTIPTPSADNQTTGPIRTTYVADPRDPTSGGNWWGSGSSPYLQFPDVALNHPERWSLDKETSDLGDQCLPGAMNKYDCMSFNEADFANGDVWITPFYAMRGFFITTTLAAGDGPQLTEAPAGQDLFLQARIYNYSFTEMPSGSSVMVDFYRQPWDHNLNEPIGDSVRINGQPIAAGRIAPFKGSSDDPNYILVHQDLETDDLGGTYQVFWVVVWIEGADGSLVEEVPDHGLTEIPGVLGWAPDTPIERHSNNVGVYKVAFHITGGADDAVAATSGLLPRERELRVENVALSDSVVAENDPVVVSAQIGATGADVSGVQVILAAVNLQGDRVEFDEERLSFIADGDTHQVRVIYRPQICGPQRIEIFARDTTHFLPAAGGANLEVLCEPAGTPTPIPSGDDDGCQTTPGSSPPDGSWAIVLAAYLAAVTRRWTRGASGRHAT